MGRGGAVDRCLDCLQHSHSQMSNLSLRTRVNSNRKLRVRGHASTCATVAAGRTPRMLVVLAIMLLVVYVLLMPVVCRCADQVIHALLLDVCLHAPSDAASFAGDAPRTHQADRQHETPTNMTSSLSGVGVLQCTRQFPG